MHKNGRNFSEQIRNDEGHSLVNEVYRLEKNCAVVVFDGENPDGTLCCGSGRWATLFNEDEANDFVDEFSTLFPDSKYVAYRLHQLGIA